MTVFEGLNLDEENPLEYREYVGLEKAEEDSQLKGESVVIVTDNINADKLMARLKQNTWACKCRLLTLATIVDNDPQPYLLNQINQWVDKQKQGINHSNQE